MFWMLYAVGNVFAVIKEIDARFVNLHGIYSLSKALLYIYFGAGIGNVIAYTGRNAGFNFSYYFNPVFLYSQLIYGNALIFFGAAAGAGFSFFIDYLYDSLNNS